MDDSSTVLTKSIIPKAESFNALVGGKQTALFVLQNDANMVVALTNYGARIVSVIVPDKKGSMTDVVLGYHSIEDYLKSNELYFGATIGRFSNRIANGRFVLDQVVYELEKNDKPNHLHGGVDGLHVVVWDAEQRAENQVIFRHLSEDGASGYPGKLVIEVCFTLTQENEIVIDYSAIADKRTIINLTNHAYFNLSGAGTGTIEQHILEINADNYTPLDADLIPTGDIKPVKNTPFDFTKPKMVGRDWNRNHKQLILASGYDHNFVLNKTKENALEFAARVTDPESGRVLEVETTEPGVQFYSANFLTGLDVGPTGNAYKTRTAFCLETQHFPDSPNQPGFPSVVLDACKQFKSSTIYRFLTV
jgi:aldose 1-epimerase